MSVCRCSIQVALRSLIAAVSVLLRSTMSPVFVNYESTNRRPLLYSTRSPSCEPSVVFAHSAISYRYSLVGVWFAIPKLSG